MLMTETMRGKEAGVAVMLVETGLRAETVVRAGLRTGRVVRAGRKAGGGGTTTAALMLLLRMLLSMLLQVRLSMLSPAQATTSAVRKPLRQIVMLH